jgi:mono/diheme cytochrome c family protein
MFAGAARRRQCCLIREASMNSMLRAGGFAAAGLLTLAAVAVPVAIGVRPIIGPQSRALTTRCFDATPARVERGRYLATSVAGCFSCHGETDWQAPGFPVKAGTEGGGRVWDREGLPYVTAPNITPDRETGAGTWTDDMLARAIREGIGHDGRTLFPLMPYTQYRWMSDEDVASVVVYLRSLPALERALPPTKVPFPVNRFINAVPQPVTAPISSPNRKDTVAYGDYLTRLGACRDCHTPVDARNQPIAALEFSGGFVLTGPYGQVASRNLTPAPSGIPYYNADLFVEVMRTGMVKARKVHDAMPWRAYGRETDDDLRAIFAFLQSVPAVAHRVDNTLVPTRCPVCGGLHGAGGQNIAPAGN